MGDFILKGAFICSLIFFEVSMVDFKIYSVSDKYISYLRDRYPNVYSNKEDDRTHSRKYIGTVLSLGKYKYYVPMSSPKQTDYQTVDGDRVIRKSVVPIIRMIVKNSAGNRELKGTLRISHMIPVPESELILYDLNNESDTAYKDLVNNEIIFIRKHRDRILGNAKLLYRQKNSNEECVGYVKSALPFKELEKMCDEYELKMCDNVEHKEVVE